MIHCLLVSLYPRPPQESHVGSMFIEPGRLAYVLLKMYNTWVKATTASLLIYYLTPLLGFDSVDKDNLVHGVLWFFMQQRVSVVSRNPMSLDDLQVATRNGFKSSCMNAKLYDIWWPISSGKVCV